METRQMTPFFFIYFFRSKCLQHLFLSLQVTRNLFSCGSPFGPFWSVCKIPQVLAKICRFGQLIILFSKVDTLRLLKIYIMFCSPAGAKYSFFQAPAHGLQCMNTPEIRGTGKSATDYFSVLKFICVKILGRWEISFTGDCIYQQGPAIFSQTNCYIYRKINLIFFSEVIPLMQLCRIINYFIIQCF